MSKLLCGVAGFAAVALFAKWAMDRGAQFSDDALLISLVLGASAGVLSPR